MSSKPPPTNDPRMPDSDPDPELPPDIAKALAKSGLLLPETPSEVAAAESEQGLQDLELPENLRQFRARSSGARALGVSSAEPLPLGPERPPSNVVALGSARRGKLRPWIGSALGFALGAAAASVVWQQRATERQDPNVHVGGVASELRQPKPPPAEPLRIRVEGCNECCAGTQCAAAKDEARTCPSGRSCVACSPGDAPNAYKIRISALALNDVGKTWLGTQTVALEQMQLCATIQGRALGCRSAVEAPGDLLEWVSLPVSTLASQLVGGVAITLQAPDARVLASWSSSIAVSSEILCRGVAARLAKDGGDPLGRVSVFFDDAQFVELKRAASVPELVLEQSRINVEGGSLSIYETSAAGPERFALVLGPTDRARAEAVRWQLLDQRLDGKLTFGDDHKGRPRPQ